MIADTWWQTAEYLRQGGFVMVPLVIVSIVMWTLIIDRLRVFRDLKRRDVNAAQAVVMLNEQKAKKTTGLCATLVNDFMAERAGDASLDKDILRSCTMHLKRQLDDRLAVIAVLAAVAPLLGLLGTVLGMVETFNVIAAFGTGNSRALAGGIGVALVTTQTGLLVAIPGMLMSNRLSRASQQLQLNLDETRAAIERRLGTTTQVGV
ncbi:MAG: biopolymer transport protein ExbB [Candidatus Krumholzibacteriia bacterium]|jgi:biopolymer transport protein ExbB